MCAETFALKAFIREKFDKSLNLLLGDAFVVHEPRFFALKYQKKIFPN